MKNTKTTLGDKIQIITLLANFMLTIGLTIWNVRQSERIAKLEYDELAPRIVIHRKVTPNLELDFAIYSWLIRNNGRTAAENVVISVYSNSEFSFRDCSLGVPFDNIPKRVSGDYILFEGLTLSPQGTVSVSCSTNSGLMAFMEKHKVFPETIPSLNCAQSGAYDFNLVYILPNLGITANNLDPSKISCVEEMSDLYK
ncbi:MAG: hypothetical protein ACOYYF_16020 [Chloroflexota bacterium]|nr:hypothetical protein [Chloroflexota bacterium]MBI5704443.1 hypothetical protein [Chloroflexota bacterium]